MAVRKAKGREILTIVDNIFSKYIVYYPESFEVFELQAKQGETFCRRNCHNKVSYFSIPVSPEKLRNITFIL